MITPVIVVTEPDDWPFAIAGVEVVVAREYLSDARRAAGRKIKVFNLCRSYRYQKAGYYVSLLGDARGHHPLPDIATIQSLKSPTIIGVASEELETTMQEVLGPLDWDELSLYVFFGHAVDRDHAKLAAEVFRQFPAPLLRAEFATSRRTGRWRLRNVQPLALGDVPEHLHPEIERAAVAYFPTRYHPRPRRESAAYDLAILCDPHEPEPPSDERALARFVEAAEAEGFEVERVGRDDLDRIAEFDALFIRETTSVNHRTYRFAQKAEAEGLVVIDDPLSILRCTNKVFLAELLQRHEVSAPPTMVVHRNNVAEVEARLGLPCILKQPDSSFSQGVVKVDDEGGLRDELERMFDRSDLVIAQAFTPTPFDWRVGVLDRRAVYACKYFMAPRHWQIIRRDGDERDDGEVQAVPLDRVPTAVLATAVRAANLIGDGLYGVDLKQIDGEPQVIEVNDNPSIDAGYEDALLGSELYARIMRVFRERVDRRGRRP